MMTSFNLIEPKDLGGELGHDDGSRPGITVRRYMRKKYPDHPKGTRWRLTPEQADDVRRHFDTPPRGARLMPSSTGHALRQHALLDLTASAVAAFTEERWAITDAAQHVPSRPGLYAIYGDEQAWRDLQLEAEPDRPLYVGKAEKSLVSRDLNGHFATNPKSTPRTGGSTVRRSFAALLRDTLDLHAVPRNLAKPERFANYALAEGGDARLNEWMHARLTLAVWPALDGTPVLLGDIETSAIVHFAPPINLDKNPRKLARLSIARAEMAAEASRWRTGS